MVQGGFDSIITRMQDYLVEGPLFVLGSGASAACGLPTMQSLAETVKANGRVAGNPSFKCLCDCLSAGEGLEAALDASDLKPNEVEIIRDITWNKIIEGDRAYINSCLNSAKTCTLAKLLNRALSTASVNATVVTTNYDRLVEYAADELNASCVTGFEGKVVGKFELPPQKVFGARIRARERNICLWKVHGSVDWFKHEDGRILSLPASGHIPTGCSPLIIPPSKDKYRETHDDPYREVIQKADEAFSKARCFLCIGYGFNDNHIHPILKREVEAGKPLVIATHSLTKTCREWLTASGPQKVLTLEADGADGTRVTIEGESIIVEGNYWSMEGFDQIW